VIDFRLSADEESVAEAAAKVAVSAEPWAALVDGGWLELLVDDPESGLGYLGLVAEELGAAGAAVAFAGAAAVWPTLFAESAAGRRVGMVDRELGGFCEDGAAADVAVVFTNGDARAFGIVSAEAVGGLEGDGLARVALSDDPVASTDDPERVSRARLLGAALVGAEMAGAIRRAADMTITHVQDRHQFGRPLSKFQVVQHAAARLAELAEAATWVARLAYLDPKPEHIHAAKGWLSAASVEVSALAHEFHGAIGFTEEYGLQRVTKRLRTLRFAWGHEAPHHVALGRLRTGH
jgi:acyl-CoA dehydrogenase